MPKIKFTLLLPITVLVIIKAMTVTATPNAEETTDDKDTETLRHLQELHSGRLVQRTLVKPEPCSPVSEEGDTLEVLYSGYFTDGRLFDSSHGKSPVSFTIGKSRVIKGWEEGVLGMCQGEKRRLMVPPHLAYGDTGYPPVIPPKTPLLFELHLVKLTKAGSNLGLAGHMTSWFSMMVALPVIGVVLFRWLHSRYKKEISEQEQDKKEVRNSRKKR